MARLTVGLQAPWTDNSCGLAAATHDESRAEGEIGLAVVKNEILVLGFLSLLISLIVFNANEKLRSIK